MKPLPVLILPVCSAALDNVAVHQLFTYLGRGDAPHITQVRQKLSPHKSLHLALCHHVLIFM